MGYNIFPTDNDVGSTAEVGGVGTEQSFGRAFAALNSGRVAFIISGLEASTPGFDNIDVTAGTAYINGVILEIDATDQHDASASLTNNFLWIKLTRSSGKVSGYEYVETTTNVPPDDDHLMICRFTTNATPIVSSIDQAQVLHRPGIITGRYTGDNSNARMIDLGLTPRFVKVWAEASAFSRIVAESVILHEYEDPADKTGDHSLSIGDNGSASWTLSRNARPEITEGGFYVAELNSNSINDFGVDYSYFAIV
jgi:hypothetical protein